MKAAKALFNNLSERVAAINIDNDHHDNITVDHWKGKKIISMHEWKEITYSDGSPIARGLRLDQGLQYFPDQYNDLLFCVGVPNGYEDKANQWYYDYLQLHEHILITKYDPDTFGKIIEESNYQNTKKESYFHESSWYMRDQSKGYDGKGCTHNSCVPECKYFKPCLYPDLYSLSKAEIVSNGQLLNRLFCLYTNTSTPDDNKQSESQGDQP